MYIANRRKKDPYKLTKLERLICMYIIFKFTGSYTILLDKWMKDNQISLRTVMRDCRELEQSGLAVDVHIKTINSSSEICCKRKETEDEDNDLISEDIVEIPIQDLPEEVLSNPHYLKLRRLALLSDYLFSIDNPKYKKVYIAYRKSFESVNEYYYDSVWSSFNQGRGGILYPSNEELDRFQTNKQPLTARNFLDYLRSNPDYQVLTTSLRSIQREMQIIYKLCEW